MDLTTELNEKGGALYGSCTARETKQPSSTSLMARSHVVPKPGQRVPTAWASIAQTAEQKLGTPFNI